MAMVDQKEGLPTSVMIESASPHEVTLVEQTLDESFIDDEPLQVLGDKGFDSNHADDPLYCERGLELIAPERRNKHERRQDASGLPGYENRWKVERFFAWLQNFRRIVTRWDYYPENYLGFIQLACMLMLLKRL